MSNSFLFIIPLTPTSHLSESRRALRKLCLETLDNQSYTNWKALLIGEKLEIPINATHYEVIETDGFKEEKLQIATKYILDNNITGDYLIRLDDDDIFNSLILNQIKDKDFDLYVDKYHSFWNPPTNLISQRIMYWFPNTCIIKRKHALSIFGNFPVGDYQRFKSRPFLIENEHNDFHLYFDQNHNILFSTINSPVYLRVINPNSITYIQAQNHEEYMKQFGFWRKIKLRGYSLPHYLKINKDSNKSKIQTFVSMVKSLKDMLVALKNYHKIVIYKNAKSRNNKM